MNQIRANEGSLLFTSYGPSYGNKYFIEIQFKLYYIVKKLYFNLKKFIVLDGMKLGTLSDFDKLFSTQYLLKAFLKALFQRESK